MVNRVPAMMDGWIKTACMWCHCDTTGKPMQYVLIITIIRCYVILHSVGIRAITISRRTIFTDGWPLLFRLRLLLQELYMRVFRINLHICSHTRDWVRYAGKTAQHTMCTVTNVNNLKNDRMCATAITHSIFCVPTWIEYKLNVGKCRSRKTLENQIIELNRIDETVLWH